MDENLNRVKDMNNVVYLIGTGATMAEMDHQGIESHLTMTEIGDNILEMSEKTNGKYKELHDSFALVPGIDIELIMSLLEGCTFLESARFKEVYEELRKLFRLYLLSEIKDKNIEPNILSSLLYLHKEYGLYMGINGEKLLGLLTINYDSLLDKAYCIVYGGINCGYEFTSDTYTNDNSVPPLLKLHGSFNWRINEGALCISRSFEERDYEDDYSGWISPSVFKKPKGVFEKIWDEATKFLTQCDTLRVVGSSLRIEDFALLSLIFTSRLKSENIFNVELIVKDEDATGSEEHKGIIQRLPFLGDMVNYSNLDVYPEGYISKGNVLKEWLEMKITETERKKGASLSDDKFLSKRLWEA